MKIRTRANFENGNVIYPKKLFPVQTDFTATIFKIPPKYQNIFQLCCHCMPKTMGNSDL